MIFQSNPPTPVAELEPGWHGDLDMNRIYDVEAICQTLEGTGDYIDLASMASSKNDNQSIGSRLIPLILTCDRDFRLHRDVDPMMSTSHSIEYRTGVNAESLISNIYVTNTINILNSKEPPREKGVVSWAPFRHRGMAHLDNFVSKESEAAAYTASNQSGTIFWDKKFWLPKKALEGRSLLGILVDFPPLSLQTVFTPTSSKGVRPNVLYRHEPLADVHAKAATRRFTKLNRIFFRNIVKVLPENPAKKTEDITEEQAY